MNIYHKVIKLKGGYGYEIYVNDKLFIKQDFLPVIQGNIPMEEKEAKKLASLVVEKLKKDPFILPSLTEEEVLEVINRSIK